MKFVLRYQAKYEPEGNRYKMIITSICDQVANVLVFRSILSHSGVDRKGQTKPYVLQICKKRSIIWGILKVLFFCYIFLKYYRQENRNNVTRNFKLKNSSNHIVLSLLNSMTYTRKEHYFWYFFFKIKRKRSIIFKITLWNRPVSFPFRDMWTNNFFMI